MKKLENFSNCLNNLKTANFQTADNDIIYRTGIIGQFNLTFELAWKALQSVLRLHGAESADSGSPREILQLGYKTGFIDDQNVWLLMLKKRNIIVHVYNEEDADETLILIRDSFIPAFDKLEKTLYAKVKDFEDA
ncbi:MAG: HI0074 family nucleotidyltransferase substrate-binding subunit [Oscillospiraceae bacterium]|nr:HI0074 family nucleotidyltransferase substrate-binding subunit [Oscillospiraceae bacterium]